MSSDSSHGVMLNGLLQGACDFIVKPHPSEPLQLVWQHVARNRKNDFPSLGSVHIQESVNINSGGMSPEIDGSPAKELGAAAGGPTCSNPKASKRKKKEETEEEGSEGSDHQFTTAKKPRLIWTSELHRIFADAVHSLTIEKAVPKKILEYMRSNGVPDLTRENVASHLQKYRLFLRSIKDKAFGKSSELPSKSVPLNVTKESNFKQSSPPNQTYCIQNNNSSYCPVAHLPRQSLTQHETLLNEQPMDVLPPLDQTHFLDQNMMHPSFNHIVAQQQLAHAHAHDNGWDGHGETATSFQNSPIWPNTIDVFESQENANWAMQHSQHQLETMGQTVNEAADFSLRNDILHSQILSNQFSNIDDNDVHPNMGNSEYLSYDLLNDYFLRSLAMEDYKEKYETMGFENTQVDCAKNMYFPHGIYSDAFEYGYSVNEIPTTMENEFKYDHQTAFYSPDNRPDDTYTLPLNFASPREQQGEHLKRGGEGSN